MLTYHVVPATVYSAALFLESDEVEVKTVEGATIKIKKENGMFLSPMLYNVILVISFTFNYRTMNSSPKDTQL